MNSYIKAMEASLCEDSRDMLQRIYEPTVVGTPLADSRRDVCVLKNGEIRSYGRLYSKSHVGPEGQIAYLSSLDCGLSWSIKYSHGRMNSSTYIEEANIYVTACDMYNNNYGIDTGLYVYRSEIGPDDPTPQRIKLRDENFIDTFLPQKSAFGNRIWFTSQLNNDPYFFFSDDFGLTWQERRIKCPHNFEIVYPHKGNRWCKGSGCEPHVTELSKEKMMMIIRTPMDCFYKSYSYDGGNSWSDPEESCFYGTNTTAYLLRLNDGRIITFWNNTVPLAQPNYKTTDRAEDKDIINGHGENAFTNRDAAHAAISDDGGESFVGFREILLNSIRNNTDFRYIGGVATSYDKSVHQFQAFELPYNKILVSAGQNPASRRLVIFDVNWLYENTRHENFIGGMGNITYHTYLKSLSGHHVHAAGNGHCAWNRTYSAFPVPEPHGGHGEVILLQKQHNELLYNDIGGICWNFPCSKKGKVTARVMINEKQARFILSDRWFNACDPNAMFRAPFWFEIDKGDTSGDFCDVSVEYDTDSGRGTVTVDGEFLCYIKMSNPCKTGISYLILQCATDGDSKGFYIQELSKE